MKPKEETLGDLIRKTLIAEGLLEETTQEKEEENVDPNTPKSE